MNVSNYFFLNVFTLLKTFADNTNNNFYLFWEQNPINYCQTSMIRDYLSNFFYHKNL